MLYGFGRDLLYDYDLRNWNDWEVLRVDLRSASPLNRSSARRGAGSLVLADEHHTEAPALGRAPGSCIIRADRGTTGVSFSVNENPPGSRPVVARFELLFVDYMRAWIRRALGHRAFPVLSLGFLIIALRVVLSATGATRLVLALITCSLPGLLLWLLHVRYSALSRAQRVGVLTLSTSSLSLRYERGTGLEDWNSLKHVSEYRSVFVIHDLRGSTHIVPKRSLTEDDLSIVRRLFEEKVRKETRSPVAMLVTAAQWLLLAFVVFILGFWFLYQTVEYGALP